MIASRPVHARKMAARMQAQGHEVLFYENTDGGHAAAADHKQAAEMWALSFVYLKQKLMRAQWGHDERDVPTRSGGCLCGAVRYEVRGSLRPIVMCHCTQCRRMTGHLMAATAARHADFRLLTGGGLRWYASSHEARRGFCAHCGSTLFWQGVERDYISIAAGTLDDSSGLADGLSYFHRRQGVLLRDHRRHAAGHGWRHCRCRGPDAARG